MLLQQVLQGHLFQFAEAYCSIALQNLQLSTDDPVINKTLKILLLIPTLFLQKEDQLPKDSTSPVLSRSRV